MYIFFADISAGIRFLSLFGIYISVYLLITSGALLQAENPPLLPELENERFSESPSVINAGLELGIKIETVAKYNRDTIHKILKLDSESTRQELGRRFSDSNLPTVFRLLYAGILASLNDDSAQAFLMTSGRSATELHDAENVFWMISHLDWLYPVEDRNSKTINMKWAENFMLEMLKEPGTLKAAYWANGVYERQSCAIKNFGEILAKMKRQELYPVLVSLWNANPRTVNRSDIRKVFTDLGDKRAIPILLEILNKKDKGNNDEYWSVAYALAKLDAKEAIPILLTHLDDYNVYPALSQYNDARIFPALKKALPELKGDAKIKAALMIINLESGDRLPKLIEIAQNPDFQSEHYYIMEIIYRFKDERAVPVAVRELKELNSSPAIFQLIRKVQALRFLAEINNSPAAIKGLIDALDIDFNAIAQGKERINDNNKLLKAEITNHLKRMTGQDFGENKQKWLEYYRNTYNLKK